MLFVELMSNVLSFLHTLRNLKKTLPFLCYFKLLLPYLNKLKLFYFFCSLTVAILSQNISFDHNKANIILKFFFLWHSIKFLNIFSYCFFNEQKYKEKSHGHFNKCRRGLWQNPMWLPDKEKVELEGTYLSMTNTYEITHC